MELLAANMEALRSADPALAERIDRASSDETVEAFTARSGAVSLRVDGAQEASSEDPEAEGRELARHFIQSAREAGATRLVVFGLGVHTLRFLEDFDGALLVIEPSATLMRAALERIDLSQALARVPIVVGSDVAAALRHPIFTAPERGMFVSHPAARRRARELHDALACRFQPGGAPRRLDVAVVPPMYGGALPVAGACARALSELGHRVRDLDLSPFWPAYQHILRTAGDERLGALCDSLRAAVVRLVGEFLLGQIELDPPDVVLAIAGAPLDPQTLERLGRLGITRALWFCEDFRVMPYWAELVGSYDTVFHIQPHDFAAPLREAGAFGVPLPMAFDPALHRPIELTADARRRYACDLSFVGAGYHNRRQFLPALFSLGLQLYGTEWPLSAPFAAVMPEPNVRQSSESTNRIFNASRINLNLHSSPWCDGVNPMGDYVNPRTFELAGGGCFQLVDERRELGRYFDIGTEVETFADVEECRKKIRHYLAHPEERRQISAAARRRALAEHTYRHRMEQAIDALLAAPSPLIPRRRVLPTAGSVLEAASSDEPGLCEVLRRLDPQRPLDRDAISDAVGAGGGPLSRDEKLLLFMREARSEVAVLDAAGDPK